MSVHMVGGALLFVFGVLLVVVGAVFYKQDKVDSYSGVVQGVILVLGGLVALGGSAWFWVSLGG